jgi:DNA-binding NtrC family response regulator
MPARGTTGNAACVPMLAQGLDNDAMSTSEESLAGKRLLIVDMDADVVRSMTDTLFAAGASPPLVAFSAAEAVAHLGTQAVDAAIVNTDLPDETAAIVAYRLSEQNIPFACTTAPGIRSISARGKPVPVLQRPVTRDALLEVMQHLIPPVQIPQVQAVASQPSAPNVIAFKPRVG